MMFLVSIANSTVVLLLEAVLAHSIFYIFSIHLNDFEPKVIVLLVDFCHTS